MPARDRPPAIGINPNHVAARGGRIQLAADFSNYVNGYDYSSRELGNPTVVSGQPSIGVAPFGLLGQCLRIGTEAAAIGVKFAGKPATNPASIAFGLVLSWDGAGSANYIFNTSSTSAGYGLRFNGSSQIEFNATGSSILATSVITLTANAPYFVGVSGTPGGTTDFVLNDLRSGIIKYSAAVATGSAGLTPNGTFVVGADIAATRSSKSYIATAAIVYRRMALNELLEWANDPWGLLIPPMRQRRVSAPAAAAGMVPVFGGPFVGKTPVLSGPFG